MVWDLSLMFPVLSSPPTTLFYRAQAQGGVPEGAHQMCFGPVCTLNIWFRFWHLKWPKGPPPAQPLLTSVHWSHAEQDSPCSCGGPFRSVKDPLRHLPGLPCLCKTEISSSATSQASPFSTVGVPGNRPCPRPECVQFEPHELTGSKGMGVCTRFLMLK